MIRFFQNALLAACLLLGSVSRADWEGIGPEDTKVIRQLLQKANSEGYPKEFLERKIQEGLSKGKSTEEIIKALEFRYLVLEEISKEENSGKKNMAASLLKKESAAKQKVKKTASSVLKPKSTQKSEKSSKIKVKREANQKSEKYQKLKQKAKEKRADGLSAKQGDKNKGKDKLEKGPAKKAQPSGAVEQPGKNGSAKAPNPKIQKDFETKLIRKSEKHQGKMEKKMKGLEKKMEAKEKALEKKQRKISDM